MSFRQLVQTAARVVVESGDTFAVGNRVYILGNTAKDRARGHTSGLPPSQGGGQRGVVTAVTTPHGPGMGSYLTIQTDNGRTYDDINSSWARKLKESGTSAGFRINVESLPAPLPIGRRVTIKDAWGGHRDAYGTIKSYDGVTMSEDHGEQHQYTVVLSSGEEYYAMGWELR